MPLLKITWKKSSIGYDRRQRRVIRALGLRHLHHTVMHQDSSTIRGMINAVSHMLEVEQLDQEDSHEN